MRKAAMMMDLQLILMSKSVTMIESQYGKQPAEIQGCKYSLQL
jgi:hypothetical protein